MNEFNDTCFGANSDWADARRNGPAQGNFEEYMFGEAPLNGYRQGRTEKEEAPLSGYLRGRNQEEERPLSGFMRTPGQNSDSKSTESLDCGENDPFSKNHNPSKGLSDKNEKPAEGISNGAKELDSKNTDGTDNPMPLEESAKQPLNPSFMDKLMDMMGGPIPKTPEQKGPFNFNTGKPNNTTDKNPSTGVNPEGKYPFKQGILPPLTPVEI